jgi:hypothetical protein
MIVRGGSWLQMSQEEKMKALEEAKRTKGRRK